VFGRGVILMAATGRGQAPEFHLRKWRIADEVHTDDEDSAVAQSKSYCAGGDARSLAVWRRVRARCKRPARLRAADITSVPVALPLRVCRPVESSQDGDVYYVWSDSKFYVCHGSTKTWSRLNLNGLNAAVSLTNR